MKENINFKSSVFILMVAVIAVYLTSYFEDKNIQNENLVKKVEPAAPENEIVIDRNNRIEEIRSHDGMYWYGHNVNGTYIEFNRKIVNSTIPTEKIGSIDIGEHIKSVNVFYGIDEQLLVVAISQNDEEFKEIDDLDSKFSERIYIYNLVDNTIRKVYMGKTYAGAWLTPIYFNSEDVYFARSAFEGMSRLMRLDVKTGEFDDISALSKFYIPRSNLVRVSPNGRYFALATAMRSDTYVYSNQLSIYDVQTRKITHSNLVTSATGEGWDWDHFESFYWNDDSSALSVEVKEYYQVNLDGSFVKSTR
jgi:hypothetical protein